MFVFVADFQCLPERLYNFLFLAFIDPDKNLFDVPGFPGFLKKVKTAKQ